MFPKAEREKRQKLTIDFVIERCIRMEDTERANKFSKFNNAILLYIKQIKHPVCKKVLSFAFEQRQLKFFLVDETIIKDGTTDLLEQLIQGLNLTHTEGCFSSKNCGVFIALWLFYHFGMKATHDEDEAVIL